MSSGNFKAQYKGAANQTWQTKTTGSESSCLSSYQKLKQTHDFARVIDPDGRTVT